MASAFNNADALTELNLTEVINIWSIKRVVFFSLGEIKPNLSEKVLWLQLGLSQNIFLTLSNNIVCLSCNGMS